MAVKKGLGKGLDALFLDNSTQSANSGSEILKINEIEPNRNQPRKLFEDEPLQQLAESIREHGLIQPLLVRPQKAGGYQIIAGERRWRASRMAGLSEVPVIIMDIDDAKTMALALIENLQRENLNAIEEALGYKDLIESYDMTQADVSKSVGKSRSAVANTLRLLNLPKTVVDYVRTGELSSGHARALLALDEDEKMLSIAQKAVQQGLSVRDVEKLTKNCGQVSSKPAKAGKEQLKDSYFKEVELALKEELHRQVKVTIKQNGEGTLELSFFNKEDLQALIEASFK
ncbi:MAG: ParB/RepB/Spo0J family partition protein [Oscillospiraceae bacterium]